MEVWWDMTCCVVAKVHNVNCTSRSDMIRASDIHPMRQRQVVERVPKEMQRFYLKQLVQVGVR